jgi:hypothetical protein
MDAGANPGAGAAPGPGTDGASRAGRLESGASQRDGSSADTGAEKREPAQDSGRAATKDGRGDNSDAKADRAATKDGSNTDSQSTSKRADDKTSPTSPAAEGKSTGEQGSDARSSDSASGSLTGEKRTQVQKAFSSHRSGAKVDVDIQVSVGVAVPRHVHLVSLPEDIIVIVPQWRRYKYIVVEDTICIVDPVTYEIVDVLVLA